MQHTLSELYVHKIYGHLLEWNRNGGDILSGSLWENQENVIDRHIPDLQKSPLYFFNQPCRALFCKSLNCYDWMVVAMATNILSDLGYNPNSDFVQKTQKITKYQLQF